MPENCNVSVVEWGSSPSSLRHQLLAPAMARDTRGECRHEEEWELSSSSHNSSEYTDSNSNTIQDRVHRILSQWEEKRTRMILKWGSLGVKSGEYARIMHLMAIEKKQMEEMQQRRKKMKQTKQVEQRRKEQCIRMAANASARRHTNEAFKKGEMNNKESMSRVPRPPPTPKADNETTKKTVPVRMRHFSLDPKHKEGVTSHEEDVDLS